MLARILTDCSIIFVIGSSMIPPTSQAQDVPVKDCNYWDELADKTEAVYDERLWKIRAEINHLGDHPWAGEYVTLGRFLAIAPESGYVSATVSCMGPSEHEYGSVTVEEDGIVTLSPSGSLPLFGQGVETDLIQVTWGERQYLVPIDKVGSFCNSVHSSLGDRAANWNGYLRLKYSLTPVTGLPTLPPRFDHLLVKETLRSSITEIVLNLLDEVSNRALRERETTVRIGIGATSGVREGMVFSIVLPPTMLPLELTITKVEQDSSIGTILQWFPGDSIFEAGYPQVGWRVIAGPRNRGDVIDAETWFAEQQSAALSCDCPGDVNGDRRIDDGDIAAFINCFAGARADCACADVDGIGGLDADDIPAFAAAIIASANCD